MGVPDRRLSRPVSRSVATPMARDWKLVYMIPPAIMPAVKSCPTVTPCAAAWSPKMDPSRTSRIDGRPKINATAILSLKNDLTSTPPRATPSRQALGSVTSVVATASAVVVTVPVVTVASAVVAGTPLVLWVMAGLRDQFEVNVFERRPGHGEAGDLAAELPAPLRDGVGRLGGLVCAA